MFIFSYLLGCTLYTKEDSVDSSVLSHQERSIDSDVKTDVLWKTADCPDSMWNICNPQADSFLNSGTE